MTAPVTIREIGPADIGLYAGISPAYTVKSVLRVALVDSGLGGMVFREAPVAPPYVKDYDAYDGAGPERWLQRFDVSRWGFFVALAGDSPVGGATVAFETPGVNMLGGRRDVAALWDLRVRPDWRRRGIGTRLFRRAAAWARERGCRQLKIETQNVNVPACRFYVRRGCRLGVADRYGYFGHPQVGHEVMLIWYLELGAARSRGRNACLAGGGGAQ